MKMMDFVFKMMDFVFKMVNFGRVPTRTRSSCPTPTSTSSPRTTAAGTSVRPPQNAE